MKHELASYGISVPDGASWVAIEAPVSFSADQERMAIKEAIDLANRRGLRDFFYDGLASTSTISILDQYQFVHEGLVKYELDQRSRIAVLIGAKDSSRDFFETVLRNEGYNCRLFTDRTEATDWLRKREPRWA